MPFFIVLFILIVFTIKYDILHHTKNKVFWFFVCAAICGLLAGFRYQVGLDSINYEQLFEEASFDFITYGFEGTIGTYQYEPLWMLLYYLVNLIGGDYYTFQLIVGLVVNFVIFYFFYKYSTHYFTCTLIYFALSFLYLNTEIMRAVLSICVLLLSYKYLIKKKYLKFILWMLFATLFHRSAAILAIICPLGAKFVGRKIISVTNIFIIVVICLLIRPSFLGNYLNPTFFGVWSEKVSIYNDKTMATNVIIMQCINTFLSLLIIISRQGRQNSAIDLGLNLYFLFNCFSIANYGLMSRWCDFFVLFYYLAIVDTIYNIARSRFIAIACVTINILWTIYLSFKPIQGMSYIKYYNKYFPYTTIFNKQNIDERESLLDYMRN